MLAGSLGIQVIQTGLNTGIGLQIFLKKLLENLILALILLVVAIPQGLRMTVDVSLANSAAQMFNKSQILVKDLVSIEKTGQITKVIAPKSNVMTKQPVVAKILIGGELVLPS